ncbi:IQ domain-containing protein K isoform X2 [Apus apus]|uniref:IQ domain-containing protein K isoform X2 n=1 Tax=Apus apus TaxID=8895 RepID=UPI0021F8D5B7|nr:IQ domain-containing protein K isoform X2 [Apus apus]
MAEGGQALGLWERVCAEYEAEQPQFPGVPEPKHRSVSLKAGILQSLHMEQLYSAETVVQQLLPMPEAAPFPEPPDPKTCSPQEYLEYYIFPVLLPGIAELLHRAKEEKCFERKRTTFIACDFLTEWLYNKNPKRKDESFTEFFSIPFVTEWLNDHPRPPTPLSEEEASVVIQSFWRGYRVRCNSEIQELRQWQKQLREKNNIIKRVKEFWTKQEAKALSCCLGRKSTNNRKVLFLLFANMQTTELSTSYYCSHHLSAEGKQQN